MKFFTIIILSFICHKLTAQQPPDSFYLKCLERHLIGYYDNLPKVLYVQETAGITDYIPDRVQNVIIVKVTDKTIRKISRDGAVLVQIYPATIQSKRIEISIVEYSALKKKSKVHFVRHGGSYFEIGCRNSEYLIIEETHQGI